MRSTSAAATRCSTCWSTILGWKCEVPAASLYLWPKVPAGYTSVEFADKILLETGVSLTPGSAFGAHGEGYLRISLGQTTERFMAAVERLRGFKA